jgi:hypothetical protein
MMPTDLIANVDRGSRLQTIFRVLLTVIGERILSIILMAVK